MLPGVQVGWDYFLHSTHLRSINTPDSDSYPNRPSLSSQASGKIVLKEIKMTKYMSTTCCLPLFIDNIIDLYRKILMGGILVNLANKCYSPILYPAKFQIH